VGANPASGIQWVRAPYYRGTEGKDKGVWVLAGRVGFGLSRKEGDADQIYNELKPLLEAQMKSHGIGKAKPINGGLEWNVGKDKNVTLLITQETNPITDDPRPGKLVVLGIGPKGDGEI
jgi:hypothetical protein